MARPTVRTPIRQEAIVTALRAGATRMAAARHAAISYDVMKRWLDSSRSFADECERAEADWELRMVVLASRHASTGRVNPLDLLAKHPRTRAEWGPGAQRITVEGGGEPVRVETRHELAAIPDTAAQLREIGAVLDVLARVGAIGPPPALFPPPTDDTS